MFRGFTLFIPFGESWFMIHHWWIRHMNLFRYVMLSSLEHSKTSLWSLRFANFCFHAKWHNILKWHILRQKVWFYVLIIIYFPVPQRTPTTCLLGRAHAHITPSARLDSNLSVSNSISPHYKYPPIGGSISNWRVGWAHRTGQIQPEPD